VKYALFALSLAACAPNEIAPATPVYADVAPLFSRECISCHASDAPAAGWSAERYLDVIACPAGEGPAVEPPDDSTLSRALDRADHQGLLDERELALVRAWVEAGAPSSRGEMHPVGWADPRSDEFHGRALREERWASILDASTPTWCARCHDGADVDRRVPAPGATSCTSCHADDDGPLACSSCHGTPGRPYPPRDACFHPGEAPGAHAAHVERGFECTLCHGARDVASLGTSEHGDGTVQVAFDARAGEGASWDGDARTCTNACHTRGGTMEEPSWDATGLDCSSCHQSPPADHYPGTCDRCHAEASADGTALRAGALHLNGVVDLGDGSGTCAACHGSASDPAPATAAHPAHRAPRIAAPFDCAECHAVPSEVHDAGHLDGTVDVALGALARARGATPSYDGETCSGVACHGAGLAGGTHPSPRWRADTIAGECGACHGTPPPAPHTENTDCGASLCHGGGVAPGPRITELGRVTHVDGRITP
jgi:predicted CxxxxCH...CXXCH cytochrome family protein